MILWWNCLGASLLVIEQTKEIWMNVELSYSERYVFWYFYFRLHSSDFDKKIAALVPYLLFFFCVLMANARKLALSPLTIVCLYIW
jgi:hypothetical protein